jgi:predicted SprT family Zn-dependent metalloprotease
MDAATIKIHNKLKYMRKDELQGFVYESCFYCGRAMRNVEDVRVEVDTDRYCCEKCEDRLELRVVKACGV